MKANQQNWDEHLQQLAGAIHSTVNRNTGLAPNLMMLGHEITLPIDLMIGTIETSNLSSSEYVVRLKNIVQQVHQLAEIICYLPNYDRRKVMMSD